MTNRFSGSLLMALWLAAMNLCPAADYTINPLSVPSAEKQALL